MEDKIEKIKKISKATKGVELPMPAEELARVAPNKEHFDDLLKQNKPEKIVLDKQEGTPRNSLMDEVREVGSRNDKPTVVTPAELIAKTEQVTHRMGELKARLEQPGIQVKESAVPLLNNKLSHIDENIKIALKKTGTETAPMSPVAPSDNPIMRFLGFLTHGQYQLNTLAMEVEKWHLNGKEITPAAMLSLQIKVGYITQELEFFSSLLNKALESTKTIMNVQV